LPDALTLFRWGTVFAAYSVSLATKGTSFMTNPFSIVGVRAAAAYGPPFLPPRKSPSDDGRPTLHLPTPGLLRPGSILVEQPVPATPAEPPELRR
jgi:hypothetical protein